MIDSLNATWEEPFTIKTDTGIELNLLSNDKGLFQHNLREAIRDMVILKDSPVHTHKDLDGGPPFLCNLNTMLLRNSEKTRPDKRLPFLNLFE